VVQASVDGDAHRAHNHDERLLVWVGKTDKRGTRESDRARDKFSRKSAANALKNAGKSHFALDTFLPIGRIRTGIAG